MTDDEAQAAQDALASAIREYTKLVDPDAYVDGWVLITHKLSVEMEANNSTAVGHLVPTGQPFPMTIGLLRAATIQSESDLLVVEDE